MTGWAAMLDSAALTSEAGADTFDPEVLNGFAKCAAPVASLLSVLGGGCLVVCCLSLRKRHPHELLRKQLLQLGAADVALGLWTGWLNFAVLGGLKHLSWCWLNGVVHRCLMMLSILLSLTLAIGLLYQLQRKPAPRLLRHAVWLALPTSVVLNVPFLVFPASADDDFFQLCRTDARASNVNLLQVTILFATICGLHVAVLLQTRLRALHSVHRRSVGHASRYLAAFFLTYVVHVAYHLWFWLHPASTRGSGLEVYTLLRMAGTVLASLNGFFNFLAFWVHARRLASQRRIAMAVAFRSGSDLEETVEVPHGEEARRGPPRNPRRKRPGTAWSLGEEAGPEAAREELGSFLQELYGPLEERTPPSGCSKAEMEAPTLSPALSRSDALSPLRSEGHQEPCIA